MQTLRFDKLFRRRRRYLIGSTRSTRLDLKEIIKYFADAKGKKDWQIVYNATASSLYECRAHSSWLPTVDSVMRALGA